MRGGKRELAKDVSGETLLSVLLLDGLVPVDRGELEHASMRPAGQQAEQVAQVAPGLDRVKLAACEQRDEGRVDLACVVAADEEPVAAAHNLTPELKFAPIIVCVLESHARLAGENPARSTVAPTGSTRGGSGGNE